MSRLLALLPLFGCAAPVDPEPRVGTACPTTVIREVADHWMDTHPDPGDSKWARAVYFTGHMAAYGTLGDARYLAYATDWAERHDWQINRGPETRNADDFAAAQTYLYLDAIDPDRRRLESTFATTDALLDCGSPTEWSWIDAQYMASPVLAELALRTGDTRYTERMWALYQSAKVARGLFDDEAGLWFRDRNYLFPAVKTAHGEKVFWSRGNGWVIASLVRTLDFLPTDHPHRADYEAMLRRMAGALIPLQREDGLWPASLHDPSEFEGPETSGTAFFVYAIASGIQMGVLDRETFLPVVERGWRGITGVALQEGGGVGFVQGVGEAPGDHQPVTFAATADYGVGAVLLAGSAVSSSGLDFECR